MIITEIYNTISFDYSFSITPSEQKTVILLEGLPTTSKKHQLMLDLNARGYDVFYPQYEGTRDSYGEFLARNPVDPIDEFISNLHLGMMLKNNISFKTDSIYVLGSSFGGGIALSLQDQKYIKKVVVASPVISFKLVKGIETLEAYISKNLSDLYRYKKDNWDKMINDGFFCPLKKTALPHNKVLILGGAHDLEILSSDLNKYTEEKNLSLKILEDKSHITLSKIDESVLDIIDKFYKS